MTDFHTGNGLSTILKLLLFNKAPEILRSAAFSGELELLIQGLVSAPAAERPIYGDAIMAFLEGSGLGGM